MKSRSHQTGIGRNLMTACVLGCLLVGCNVVGPSAIRSGRLAYNEVIAETDSQQMLLAVIRTRYEESGSLLAVASVTANFRVTTSTAIQFGFGNDDNYAGNLVPFGAGAIYEENPTISYRPVAGEKYARQLMSPIPVAVLARFAGTLAEPAPVYTALVSSVNGIDNPDFLFSSAQVDPKFSRFVTIMTELTQAHRLHWVEDPHNAGSFSIVIDRFAPSYVAEVAELLHVLGLSALKEDSQRVVLPVPLALDGRSRGGIGITTRSIFDLVEILSAVIEVPEEDQQNGVTVSYPSMGLVGKDLRVRRSGGRPEHASVAVKYRDGWFYIDDKDLVTKKFFKLLGDLWASTIAESDANAGAAPIMTVPVSR